MLQAAFLGGLFSGIVGALPIVGLGNCCCCLWNLCGGAIAAYLEQQNTGRPTNVGRGAMAGVASGVLGAFVWLFITLAFGALMGTPDLALQRAAEGRADIPPEVADLIQAMGEAGPGVLYAAMFFMFLCVGSVFSTIGGALAGAFFRNDVPPALGGPIAPPPPTFPLS